MTRPAAAPAATILAAVLVLLLPGPAPAQPARAPDADATWRARLICDPLPPISATRRHANFLLTVAGGVARYERVLLDTEGAASFVERGQGRVDPDGSLTLEGSGTGRGVRVPTRYSGRLQADGLGDLRGRQEWGPDSPVGQRTRPCHMRLWRQ